MNSFPPRRLDPSPYALSDLAERLGASSPGFEGEVRGIAPLTSAGPEEIGLLADGRYIAALPGSRAGALLVSEELNERLGDDERPRLVVKDAHAALATLLELFHPEEPAEAEVHPTAVLGHGVRLGRDVRIGPYAVVEDNVAIGDETTIGAHAVVGAGSRVGRQGAVHPHAVLYPGTRLGDRVILHAGACVGVDGFGYVSREGAHQKIPQVGECIVEDDVEIGANTTVDRGSIGATRVEAGAKLDNLVQLGHNVVVGPLSLLAAQVGIAGSSRLGTGVLAGGQAGVGGHLSVGDGARLAAQAGVAGDIPPGSEVMGFLARPRSEFLRAAAAQARFPEVVKRVRRLEKIVRELAEEEGSETTSS